MFASRERSLEHHDPHRSGRGTACPAGEAGSRRQEHVARRAPAPSWRRAGRRRVTSSCTCWSYPSCRAPGIETTSQTWSCGLNSCPPELTKSPAVKRDLDLPAVKGSPTAGALCQLSRGRAWAHRDTRSGNPQASESARFYRVAEVGKGCPPIGLFRHRASRRLDAASRVAQQDRAFRRQFSLWEPVPQNARQPLDRAYLVEHIVSPLV